MCVLLMLTHSWVKLFVDQEEVACAEGRLLALGHAVYGVTRSDRGIHS